MEASIDRACGLDVHQATVVACLLTGLANGKVKRGLRTFGTTTRDLLGLREWLQSAMESTGVYWKPVYAVLEGALEIIVANAQQIKKVPGRKTGCEGRGVDCRSPPSRAAAPKLRSSQTDPRAAGPASLPPQTGGEPECRTQPSGEVAGDGQHQIGGGGQ